MVRWNYWPNSSIKQLDSSCRRPLWTLNEGRRKRWDRFRSSTNLLNLCQSSVEVKRFSNRKLFESHQLSTTDGIRLKPDSLCEFLLKCNAFSKFLIPRMVCALHLLSLSLQKDHCRSTEIVSPGRCVGPTAALNASGLVDAVELFLPLICSITNISAIFECATRWNR